MPRVEVCVSELRCCICLEHSRMSATHLLASLVIIMTCNISHGINFTVAPGLVWTYLGESASLIWTLDTRLDQLNLTRVTLRQGNTDTYLWRRRNIVLKNLPNLTLSMNTENIRFDFLEVSGSDVNDSYTCQINFQINATQGILNNSDAHLGILDTPEQPDIVLSTSSLIESDNFTLTCSTTSNSIPNTRLPNMNYTWTRDGQSLPTVRHSTSGQSGEILVIDPVSREDHDKVYTCQVQEEGSRLSNSNNITLDVKYGPSEVTFSGGGSITVEEGETVNVICVSDCSPRCTFTWVGPGFFDYHTEPNISLQSVNRTQNGTYVCNASNVHGSRNGTLQVNINYSPSIVEFLSSECNASSGDTATLNCTANGRPEPNITISNNWTVVAGPTQNSAVFTFERLTVLNSSLFYCTAENDVSRVEANNVIKLDVKGGFGLCYGQTEDNAWKINIGSSLEDKICLFANPLPKITSSNWTFKSDNGAGAGALPKAVSTDSVHTDHMYKKNVTLSIAEMTSQLYGVYTMTVTNSEGSPLVYELRVETEGGGGIQLYGIGIIAGVGVALIIVIIFVVLWRKGILPKKEDPPQRIVSGSKMNTGFSFDNVTYADGDIIRGHRPTPSASHPGAGTHGDSVGNRDYEDTWTGQRSGDELTKLPKLEETEAPKRSVPGDVESDEEDVDRPALPNRQYNGPPSTGDTKKTPELKPFVGEDGTTYALLDMMDPEAVARAHAKQKAKPKPDVVIHGADNKTEYASIAQAIPKKR